MNDYIILGSAALCGVLAICLSCVALIDAMGGRADPPALWAILGALGGSLTTVIAYYIRDRRQ